VKAKDQHNYIEKDGKFICKLCSREFASLASFGSHMSWHISGPRPKLVKHLEKARKNIDQAYRVARTYEVQSKLFLDPEWSAKRNKKVSTGMKISKKAILQRHKRSQKGAVAKMRTKLRYIYNNHKFRSTYEVRFAYVLDLLEIAWKFEPKWIHYQTDEKDKRYRPDFYLPEFDIYIEVTGFTPKSKAEKLLAVSKQNELILLVLEGISLTNIGLNNHLIEFHKDKKSKLIYANTEPSQIRNDLEGVETTIESLRHQFFAMVSKLHECLSIVNDRRYSPNLQETVRAEDKELQDNTNVVYCPYVLNVRHCQVTDNENSVNCGDIRVSQATNSNELVTMLECGQSAAKPLKRGRLRDCNQNISKEMMGQSDLYGDIKKSTEMIDSIL